MMSEPEGPWWKQIRTYVLKHEKYFEALGFQRPAGSPGTTRSSDPRSGPWTWPRSKDCRREERARRTGPIGPERPYGIIWNVPGSQGTAGQNKVPGRPGTHSRADSRSTGPHRGRCPKRPGHGPPRIRPGCGSAGAHAGDNSLSERVRAHRSW